MRAALVALCALLILAACSDSATPEPESEIAQRIVSLAPHLTELLYTIGAGEQLVAVSAWSDYPREVLELPVVGDAFTVDHEQLKLINPDLLLVWESGTPEHTVEKLRGQGYRVVALRTRSLDDVAKAMIELGELTGRTKTAAAAAEKFRREIQTLRDAYADRQSIRVFYQVAARPLFTVNHEHYVSELIELCGGSNIFSDLSELAPTVDVEAVVARNPEAMLASTDAGDDAFVEWQRWPTIDANRFGNQFLLPADEIGRATTRLLVAGNAMCIAIEKARQNRDLAQQP